MEKDDGAGGRSDPVPDLGTAAFDGPDDGPGDGLRLGNPARPVHRPHVFGHDEGGIFVRGARGRFGQVVCRDGAPVRPDGAGLDQDDVDAEGLEFHAQRIAEGLDGEFRHMIPAAVVDGGLSGHGRDVDDTARTPFPHGRNHFAAQGGQPEHIDFQLTARLFHRNVFDGAEGTVTSVVDQDVDPPFRRQHLRHAVFDGSLVRDIHIHRNDPVFTQSFHLPEAPRCGIHTVAFAGQGTGGLETDAAARTRNQYHLHGWHHRPQR